MKLGLQAKLLGATALVVGLSFVSVWKFATGTARQGLVELSDRNLVQGAQNLGRTVRGLLDDSRADTVAAARLDLAPEAIESGDPKNFVYFADQLMRSKAKYAALVVSTRESGAIVAANTIDRFGAPMKQPLVGKKASGAWTDGTYAQCADGELEGEPPAPEPIWIEPSRPEFLAGALKANERVVGYAVPVRDLLGKCIGSLSLYVSLDYLSDETLTGYVTTSNAAVDSLAAITDGHGKTLLLPRGLAAWETIGLGDAAASRGEATVIRGPGDTAFYGVHAPITDRKPIQDWSVVQLTREGKVQAPILQIREQLVTVFVVALLLTLVVLAAVATRFLSPIKRLSSVISSTKKASEFKAIEVESEDEVGALTGNFNRMFETIRDYEGSLEEKVAARTAELAAAKREVSDILDNMSQGIFTIGAAGKVNNEYSAYCKQIFGSGAEIAGANALSLLRLEQGVDKQTLGRMEFWLDNIFGSDELQWMLSADDVVKEFEYRPEGDGASVEPKRLQLEYAPIYENDEIVKVMVVAKDVTELAQLEAEVVEKERENQQNISRMAEISSMDPELFETFIEESNGILDDCEKTVGLLETDASNSDAINKLFRGMHTLKGNARIFRITSVQDRAHKVEDFFDKIRNGEEKVTPDVIAEVRAEVHAVRALIGEFERLGRRVLLGETSTALDGASDGFRQFAEEARATLKTAREALVRLEDAFSTERFDKFCELVADIRDKARDRRLLSVERVCSHLLSQVQGASETMSPAAADGLSALEAKLERATKLSDDLASATGLEVFFDEALRMKELLGAELARWTDDIGGREHSNALMRHAHTLKAMARSAGLKTVQDDVHAAEEFFAKVRDEKEAPTVAVLDEAKRLVAELNGLVEDCEALSRAPEARAKSATARAIGHMVQSLSQTLSEVEAGVLSKERMSDEAIGAALSGVEAQAEESRQTWLAAAIRRTRQALGASAADEADGAHVVTALTALTKHGRELSSLVSQLAACSDAQAFLDAARRHSDAASALVAPLKADAAGASVSIDAVKLGVSALKAEARTFGVRTVQDLVHDLEIWLTSASVAGGAPSPDDRARLVEEISQLERLVSDCGVMVTDLRAAAGERGGARKGKSTKIPEARILELRKSFKELSRALDEEKGVAPALVSQFEAVGDAIQDLTKVPLSELFERFRKMIFDLGRELDKPVADLKVTGDDIEVDAKLIEKLRDVLIHALRNSVDHGIEHSGKRPEGKPPKGQIAVECAWQGNDLVFKVMDDGRGIDPAAVKARALQRGLLSEKELDSTAEAAIAELLFLPGFSMAEKITDVSGRGVGMDVIRTTMRELKGDAEIASRFGNGTTLTLRIPSDYYQQL